MPDIIERLVDAVEKLSTRVRHLETLETPVGTAPHHSTHEDGGTDELSVAGLSGKLADAQNAGWIQGTAVQAVSPSDLQVLQYIASNSRYEPKTLSSASGSTVTAGLVAASADLALTTSFQDIAGLTKTLTVVKGDTLVVLGVGNLYSTGGNSSSGKIQLLYGGTAQTGIPEATVRSSYAMLPLIGVWVITVPADGSKTFKLQAKEQVASNLLKILASYSYMAYIYIAS